MQELKGRISGQGSLNGNIRDKAKMSGTLNYAKSKPLPYYEGEYEVDPKFEEQTLETKQKSMHDDVKVHEIYTAEVDNIAGGVTFIIGR